MTIKSKKNNENNEKWACEQTRYRSLNDSYIESAK